MFAQQNDIIGLEFFDDICLRTDGLVSDIREHFRSVRLPGNAADTKNQKECKYDVRTEIHVVMIIKLFAWSLYDSQPVLR